jgi:SAM-dependent methyltransferase
LNSDPEFWHKRYRQQVGWSLQTRRYIFERIGLQTSARILEVGCGTGALTDSLAADGYTDLFGLDIDFQALAFQSDSYSLVQGNAFHLPFPNGAFDLVICHFLLLWLIDPAVAIAEMKRVVKKSGGIVALGEPDYGGRVDYPDQLETLGKMQIVALIKQCADPFMGRKLLGLFHQVGLSGIQCGIIGAEWEQKVDNTKDDLEWAVLRKDLAYTISDQEFERYQAIDRRARQDGSRVRFVPLFYAFGKVAG